MKLLDRYIGTTIIHTTFLVLLMLIGITTFITLIQEIGDIGTGNYNFLGALEHVLFDMPRQVYAFFPMAMLVGVSLGLGLLANHNELTVMRANGVPLSGITWAVIKAALLLLLLITLLGEGIGPIAEHQAEYQKTILTSKGQALETSHGTWVRDGTNFLYIDSILGHNHLQGVNRYQLDSQRKLITASYAKNGEYSHDQWTMQNVIESQINTDGIQTHQYPTANWELSLNPKLLRISAVEPEEMTLKQLFDYIRYLNKNHLNAAHYELAFWQRTFQPLATLIMVWLAIPFVFGSMRSITMGVRMSAGIAVGFGFYLLNQFFGPLGLVYQWPPIIAAIIPTLLFAFIAYGLQRKAR